MVEILDISGRQVYQSGKINNYSIDIDISTEPSGIYFIKIKRGNSNYVGKVVKQ